MPRNPLSTPSVLAPAMAPKAKPSAMKLAVPLVGLALIGGSFFAGWKIGGASEYKKGYDKAYADARTKVESNNSFGGSVSSFPIYTLSGSITAVGGGSIDISVPQTVRNPLDEQAPTTRTVNVNGETKITLEVAKTSAEVQKEQEQYGKDLAAYQKKTQSQGNLDPYPLPPQPFTTKDITLSELEVGMLVTVISESDVTKAESFTAKQITAHAVIGPGPGISPLGTSPSPTPTPAP